MSKLRPGAHKTFPKATARQTAFALSPLSVCHFSSRATATLVFVVAGFALGACEPHQDLRATLSGFCVDCHNDAERTAELTFEQRSLANVAADAEIWEKAVRKLRTGTMPPSDQPQPSAEDRSALAAWLRILARRCGGSESESGSHRDVPASQSH